MTRAGLAAALLLAACGDPVTVTVVTITAQPAVPPLATVDVTFANQNATLTEQFDLRGVTLPATFSVETPGRDGLLAMTAAALGVDGAKAARGSAEVTIRPDDVSTVELRLDPDDFLVNTVTAQDQKLIFFLGNAGRQIASTADGAFTVGFSDDCGEFNRCDVWGRNYDVRAVAQPTTLAAGTAQYNFNRSQVFGTDPAVAIGPAGQRLALWMSASQPNGNVDQILCSAIDAAGAPLTPSEVVVSPQPATAVQQPSLVALGAGRYAATWNQVVPLAQGGTFQVILGILLDDGCRPIVNGITGTAGFFEVSARGGALDHPVVAGSDGRFGFVWGNGDGLRGRFSNAEGQFGGPETILVEDDGPLRWGQQLVFAGDRYILTHGILENGAPGPELRLRPVSLAGALDGTSDTILASGALDPLEAPALARRSDGAIAVAWHGCDLPDDPGCGIVARLVRPTGVPVGRPIHVNTTTAGDQRDPSIAPLPGAFVLAWTDSSGLPPDTSESGIRARVVYPPYDEVSGVLGALCGGDFAACDEGLVCIAGSDATAHCHQACDPAAPSCPDGGTCTTADGVSGCIF